MLRSINKQHGESMQSVLKKKRKATVGRRDFTFLAAGHLVRIFMCLLKG